ncbi:glycosyltransferase [Micromonospora chokoriensis]|uniref:glycosyltransferase n=1 Tax=Micromonospora chokoriensis TaxID=356851 RepID=UPI0018DD1545|nr:glycosyltransferase [Micromonospora chokoriensis]
MRTFRPLFVGRDPVPTRPGTESVSVAEFGRPAVLSYTLTRRSEALVDALAKRDTALLHAHFGVEGVYAVPTAKALKVPLVTTLHGFDVTVSRAKMVASKKPSWLNYVTWRHSLFAEGAVFICVSEHIRRRAVEWGYPAERCHVLPIGVDVEAIQPSGPVDAPRILHVARLVEKKGTQYLLRAFAEVRKAIPASELVLIGEGPLRDSLAALARELGVEAGVRFLGAQKHSDTLRWLSQSTLLCLPSVTAQDGDQEGLGMVLLEAAASGKPVVGTHHGGIPEAVTDGANGFLVPERDVAALADRLIELLRDQNLCDRFGKVGRQTVEDQFNLSRQTVKLESLYRDLL